MLPPPPVSSYQPPPPQAESPSSLSSGYSSIPPTSAPDLPFLLPEPADLEDLLDTEELTFTEPARSSQVTAGQSSGDLSDLAKLGLLHEERLLCKDKVRTLIGPAHTDCALIGGFHGPFRAWKSPIPMP